MAAEIVPFPQTRRWPFIVRQAERAAALKPESGDRYISDQIRVQRDWMARIGISDKLIDRELRRLEAAIRTAHGRLIQQTRKPGA
ncbi:DUF6074 family protein [Bradyrhizobium sp. AZCC 1721]|uniref:DUF6074 family protein n=1 Tax=Bradyrhizobium sp. AZCC 1721 TaxID=3117016 RepID=UPI002FF3696F